MLAQAELCQESWKYFDMGKDALSRFLTENNNVEKISQAATALATALQGGRRIFTCGNGGSCCDAMHFAEELTGRYKRNRLGLPAIAIADPSHITCVANDFGYEHIFARYLQSHAQAGDAVLVFSTSGNSPNCLRAVEMARDLGCLTYGFLGKDGGELIKPGMLTNHFLVPAQDSGIIQEVHIKIVHLLIRLIEMNLGVGQE